MAFTDLHEIEAMFAALVIPSIAGMTARKSGEDAAAAKRADRAARPAFVRKADRERKRRWRASPGVQQAEADRAKERATAMTDEEIAARKLRRRDYMRAYRSGGTDVEQARDPRKPAGE